MADFEVRLEPLIGETATPTGPEQVEVPGVWMVYVYSEALKDLPLKIDAGKLHVGFIGRQVGANFCGNDNFGRFVPPQQERIISECKRLHGSASQRPPVELTPLVPVPDDGDDLLDQDDDTEME